MDIRQFMKRKSISDSRIVENISGKKKCELRFNQHTPMDIERVKSFANVHLHCVISNLKTISKISTLPLAGKFQRTPMDALISS